MRFSLLLTMGFLSFIPRAHAEWVHPFDVEQSEDFPKTLVAVVEVPAGSYVKYEIDEDTGHVVVDRFISMPVAYPANYGSIPQTLSGDGDTLDVLVLTRTPLHPGAFLEVRPIGFLRMLDEGEPDDKVLAVPADDIDPTYKKVRKLSDLPEVGIGRIEEFFRVYESLSADPDLIEIEGWKNAGEARKLLAETREAYLTGRRD